MLTIFGRKKISTDRVANMFVRTISDTVDKGFPEVAGFINDSPEFIVSPNIHGEDYGKFMMIVIAGNYSYMKQFFSNNEDTHMAHAANALFAPMFDMKTSAFEDTLKDYKEFMSRINSPSKNTLYAMSKGVFFKYNLNQHQEEYFRCMNTPNPIFLKNLDEIMRNFLWDWEAYNDKYKVTTESGY